MLHFFHASTLGLRTRHVAVLPGHGLHPFTQKYDVRKAHIPEEVRHAQKVKF